MGHTELANPMARAAGGGAAVAVAVAGQGLHARVGRSLHRAWRGPAIKAGEEEWGERGRRDKTKKINEPFSFH